jgi:hypothetical protein
MRCLQNDVLHGVTGTLGVQINGGNPGRSKFGWYGKCQRSIVANKGKHGPGLSLHQRDHLDKIQRRLSKGHTTAALLGQLPLSQPVDWVLVNVKPIHNNVALEGFVDFKNLSFY